MSRNPHLAAHALQRRNRARVEGRAASLGRWVVAGLAAVALVPLVRPVFLSFLDLPRSEWGAGLEGIAVRVGLVLVAMLALDVYTALIRSPDRAVLDLHPVDPPRVAAFEVIRVAEERAWLLPATGVVLLPIAVEGSVGAWAQVMGVAAGAFALGLTGSAAMHLLAVEVSESERFAPLLDLLRGHNPRAQAAFIYAPGAVLAAAGALVAAASHGLALAADGSTAGLALLALPFVGAALAWVPVAGLARKHWFRATAVLADIDARYAALGDREEGQRVYLDWIARFLPRDVARYALKDLRHGWRVRRIGATGPWLIGVGAMLAGWAAASVAPRNALVVVVAGIWLFAGIGVVLDRDDPPFLRRWMPPESVPRHVARVIVLALWAQGAPWLPAMAVGLRHGAGAGAWLLGVGLVSVAVAVPAATVCGRWRTWGTWVYGPVAAVAVAGTAAWLGAA